MGNLVITGTAGGDEGVRGFVAAYEATGKQKVQAGSYPQLPELAWKPGTMEHGAASTWMTGTYDPQLDLVYWPAGNPGPDFNGDNRDGDNLYSDCILALDVTPASSKFLVFPVYASRYSRLTQRFSGADRHQLAGPAPRRC